MVQNTYGVAERGKTKKSQTKHVGREGRGEFDSKKKNKKVAAGGAISWLHPFVVQDVCWLALRLSDAGGQPKNENFKGE
jgi:hypothetical protein